MGLTSPLVDSIKNMAKQDLRYRRAEKATVANMTRIYDIFCTKKDTEWNITSLSLTRKSNSGEYNTIHTATVQR